MILSIEDKFEEVLTPEYIEHYRARLVYIYGLYPIHRNVTLSIFHTIDHGEELTQYIRKELFPAHAVVLSETDQNNSCRVAAIAAATRMNHSRKLEHPRGRLKISEMANYLEFINRTIRWLREQNEIHILEYSDPDLHRMVQIVDDNLKDVRLRAQSAKDSLCIYHFMHRYVRRNRAFLPEYISRVLKIDLGDAKRRHILSNDEIGKLLELGPESVDNLFDGNAIPLELSALLRRSNHLLCPHKHTTSCSVVADWNQSLSTKPFSAANDKILVDLLTQITHDYHG